MQLHKIYWNYYNTATCEAQSGLIIKQDFTNKKKNKKNRVLHVREELVIKREMRWVNFGHLRGCNSLIPKLTNNYFVPILLH